MLTILSGVGLLLITLAGFSLFSLKMPKGQLAMSGMANAAIATFLVEAVHKYITGDLMGMDFFRTVGETSGSLGGVAAAMMVPICMGANPVFAVVAGVASGGYGILPGFIAGYLIGLIAPIVEKKLPEGLNIILGALIIFIIYGFRLSAESWKRSFQTLKISYSWVTLALPVMSIFMSVSDVLDIISKIKQFNAPVEEKVQPLEGGETA